MHMKQLKKGVFLKGVEVFKEFFNLIGDKDYKYFGYFHGGSTLLIDSNDIEGNNFKCGLFNEDQSVEYDLENNTHLSGILGSTLTGKIQYHKLDNLLPLISKSLFDY